MVLAYSSLSPAMSSTDDPGTQTATEVSNPFSPPAGSVIVVNAVAISSGVSDWSTTPFAITDSLGSHLSWNLAVDQYDNTDSQYSERIAVFWAYCPSAQTSMTVSVTVGTTSGQYVFGITCQPDIWLSANTAGPIGAIISGTAASTSTLSETITPQAVGSALMLYGGPTFDSTANPTAGTGCYGINPGNAACYFLGEWFGTGSTAPTLTTTTNPQTMAMTFAGPQTWQYVGYEILAAPSAGGAAPYQPQQHSRYYRWRRRQPQSTVLVGTVGPNTEQGPLSLVLSTLQTVIAGTVTHQGAFAVALPTLTSSLTGTAQHTESGTLAVSLPTLTTTIAGKVGHVSGLTLQLPTLTTSLSGAPQHTESGSLSVSLSTLATALTAKIAHQGSFAVSLPTLTTGLSGNAQHTETGSLSIQLPKPALSLVGTDSSGSLSPILPKPSTSITGTVVHRGAFSVALPTLATSLSGNAQHTEPGTFNIALPTLTISCTGLVGHVGAFTPALPIPVLTLSTVSISGAFIIVLPPGQRSQIEGGSFSVALPVATLSLQGKVAHNPLNLSIPRPVLSLTGIAQQSISGSLTISIVRPSVGLTAHVKMYLTGTLSIVLPSPVSSSTGVITHVGYLAISMGVSEGLSRFELFGIEWHGNVALELPTLTTQLRGKSSRPSSEYVSQGRNWSMRRRREHREQLRTARQNRGGERGYDA